MKTKTNFKIYYTNKFERIKIVFKVVSFITEMDIDVYSLTQTMTETENWGRRERETLAADNTVNKVQLLLCRDIVTKDEQEEEEAESFSVAIYTSNQSPTCGTSLRFL